MRSCMVRIVEGLLGGVIGYFLISLLDNNLPSQSQYIAIALGVLIGIFFDNFASILTRFGIADRATRLVFGLFCGSIFSIKYIQTISEGAWWVGTTGLFSVFFGLMVWSMSPNLAIRPQNVIWSNTKSKIFDIMLKGLAGIFIGLIIGLLRSFVPDSLIQSNRNSNILILSLTTLGIFIYVMLFLLRNKWSVLSGRQKFIVIIEGFLCSIFISGLVTELRLAFFFPDGSVDKSSVYLLVTGMYFGLIFGVFFGGISGILQLLTSKPIWQAIIELFVDLFGREQRSISTVKYESDYSLYNEGGKGCIIRGSSLIVASLGLSCTFCLFLGQSVGIIKVPQTISELPENCPKNCSNVQLNHLKLANTDFSDADFQKSSLFDAELSDSKFDRANLQDVVIAAAIFHKCTFLETDLRGVNASEANFQGSDLRGADLSGANMQSADFRGVDLRETKMSGTKFTNAKYDSSTMFPPGFNPEAAGFRYISDTTRTSLINADGGG